jgi:hypothetical protein
MRVCLALLVLGLAAPSFASDPPKPNFYPLIKGTKWEYRLLMDDKEFPCVCEITDHESKGGRSSARMEAKLPNSITLTEELSSDKNGVYRTAILGAKLLQPVQIVKYPVKALDTWKERVKLDVAEGTLAVTIRDAEAVIDVPAGRFTTLVVESVVEMNGERVVACIWYAQGVGIVKQETNYGARMVTMELRKFHPAK